MNLQRKSAWRIVLVAAVAIAAGAIFFVPRLRKHPVLIRGAIVLNNTDSRKELPIADVQITARNGVSSTTSRSDSSGFFSIALPPRAKLGQTITITFSHADYRPFNFIGPATDKLYVIRLNSTRAEAPLEPRHAETVVSNVFVRYSSNSVTDVNVGSAVRTFQVANTSNVPCRGQHPCSPDGEWKAAIAGVSLEAGTGNVFRNARASCIAGPCPFTKIESDNFSREGSTISVSARDWSDTATFLVEAEVYHPMVNDLVRQSYPVIFGQALNFTLPASAQGVSIEADINSLTVVFPLGPDLYLSWAQCNARITPDQTRVYRCELRPGYRFP